MGIFTHPDIMASYLKGIGYSMYREVNPAGSLIITVFQNGTQNNNGSNETYVRIQLLELNNLTVAVTPLKGQDAIIMRGRDFSRWLRNKT